MERKLVSLRQVKEVRPIEGADRIEVAVVDGWNVVVPKGSFKPGDLAVYFEIDSFLPVEPQYEFLRKSSYRKFENGEEGFRLKTIKLRGEISQGLLLRVSDIEELKDKNIEELIGQDLSPLLGVKKYEPPIPADLRGNIYGVFPGVIQKTDVERIQNVFDEFKEKYEDMDFEITVKVDGTSCTVYRLDDHIGVCSRNYELQEDDKNAYWIATKMMREALLKENRNLAIQGELAGPNIQKNRLNLHEPTVFIFEIYDIDKQQYLSPQERYDFCEKYGLKHVPILEKSSKILLHTSDIESLLKYPENITYLGNIIEGVVAKSVVDGSIKFKVINNKYLLKTENEEAEDIER